MTQAARDALRRVDAVLAENSEPLKTTIANLQVFSEGLARNTGKLDGIVAGLERMTAGGASPARKITYDLRAARAAFPARPARPSRAGIVIPEPTAVIKLDTQRFLFSSDEEYPDFAEAMWADSIPKLLQAKLLESFENYDIAHAPRAQWMECRQTINFLIDVRRFQITIDPEPVADIGLSARILSKGGKVLAARLFQDTQKLDKIEPARSAQRLTTHSDESPRI